MVPSFPHSDRPSNDKKMRERKRQDRIKGEADFPARARSKEKPTKTRRKKVPMFFTCKAKPSHKGP